MPRWISFAAFLAEAERAPRDGARQTLVDELLEERTRWPWIEGGKATFIYNSVGVKQGVALNMDSVKGDPPLLPMTNLHGTSLWYITRSFAEDDLLDYLIAVDDPMIPLAQEPDILGRISTHWRVDPANPLRMHTTQQDVSVLQMGRARPFTDWSGLRSVPHGRVAEFSLDSLQLGYKGRKLWLYAPPGYDQSGLAYPLLILQDGQWMSGPLQVPFIADALIKHGRLKPLVIAMLQSGMPDERDREYISNDKHYASTLLELLPFVQTRYRIDSTQIGIGGVSAGAIAAAHAVLKNPAVFNSLILISPPLGKGSDDALVSQYAGRFERAPVLPSRVFQSVGRYEAKARFVRPAQALRDIFQRRLGEGARYEEIGSGHGLVAFRSILPEALAWAFPG